MITVTFCISLRINFLSVFFERIINSLDFTPNKMDIFYSIMNFLLQDSLSSTIQNYFNYYLWQR